MLHVNNEKFSYINTNPMHLLNDDDCLVRAISIISNLTWQGALYELVSLSSRSGSMPNSIKNMKYYLKHKGYTKLAIAKGLTIETFINSHLLGDYLILLELDSSYHCTCVRDGILYDNYNYLYHKVAKVYTLVNVV